MKISWIIPNHNSGSFLVEAIKSIKANLGEGIDAEIIIIDDLSTDPKTIETLNAVARDNHTKVIFQTKNGGPARARNTGIRNATGEWIAFLDADDMMCPDSLKTRIDAIKNRPEIRWLAGDMLEIREPGKPVHLNSYAKATSEGENVSGELYKIENTTKRLALWGMLPYLGSMMIRSDLLTEAGLINENLVYGEDVHFCLVLSRYADLYWINRPCLLLRRYHESMTKDLVRGAKESPRALYACMIDPRLKIIRREIRWRYAADLRQSSSVFLRHGMRFAAFKFALNAVARAPNDKRSFSTLYKSLIGTTDRCD